MRGYRVSQATANEAAMGGLEVYISPSGGEYIRSDNVVHGQIRKFLVSPIQEESIPNDAFRGKVGIHFDPLDEVFSASEAEKLWGLAPGTVRAALLRDVIPGRKSGGTWLVTRATMEAHYNKQPPIELI